MAPGFENLIVWQRARKMCTDILPIIDAASARRDYRFLQELNEAASSVAANIAEGHLRGTKRQFAYFLRIAAGSNGEVRSWLYLAADRHYVAPARAAALIEATNETGRMIQGLIDSLFRGDDETPHDKESPPE